MDACDRTNIAGHIGYCHGAYNYHSVLFCGGYLATVNFDRFHVGYQLIDLYQFIRKVMEKNNYNFDMAVKIIEDTIVFCRSPEKIIGISTYYIVIRRSSGRSATAI